MANPSIPGRWVLIRDPQGLSEPIALFSTHQDADPRSILQWFVQRWCVEVTFEEVRRHLGVETQRQWVDNAIARTTPVLLGLFSWITLLTEHLMDTHPDLSTRQSAWYPKPVPTFSDALAWTRRYLWQAPQETFSMSDSDPDIVKISQQSFHSLLDTLCYAT